mgnify:CR=1 FL=1
MESIPSPYTQVFKKELNFHRKLLATDAICEKILGATKSTTITIIKGQVEVSSINMSKADLLALGNFLSEKYK